ncbi:GntR family transcriptional regulator [Oceanobacillus sp. CAU 1775]
MLIELDMTSDKPIYIQLKEQIIEGIARKELKPGDDLPSVRALASDIGINLHTVNKVYQQLKQEDYIQIHRNRGVIINPDGFAQADQAYKKKLHDTLRPLIAEAICHGLQPDEFSKMTDDIFEKILKKAGENNE